MGWPTSSVPRRVACSFAVAALWSAALGLAGCAEQEQNGDTPQGPQRQSSEGEKGAMGANETIGQRYPRPPANSNMVWQRVPPSGRMVDLETGDFVTVQSADREYEQFVLHLRDKNGLIGRVFDVQLNHGDSEPRMPY